MKTDTKQPKRGRGWQMMYYGDNPERDPVRVPKPRYKWRKKVTNNHENLSTTNFFMMSTILTAKEKKELSSTETRQEPDGEQELHHQANQMNMPMLSHGDYKNGRQNPDTPYPPKRQEL